MTTRAHLALSTAALLVLGAGALTGCRAKTTDSSPGEAVDSDTAALVTDAEDERLSRGQAMHIGTIVFAAIAHAEPD